MTAHDRPIVLKSVDVLLGRGRGTYGRQGNQAFMRIISSYVPNYAAAKSNKGELQSSVWTLWYHPIRNNLIDSIPRFPPDKIRITDEVVSLVQDTGARFLGKDDSTGEVYEVSHTEARMKVSQV